MDLDTAAISSSWFSCSTRAPLSRKATIAPLAPSSTVKARPAQNVWVGYHQGALRRILFAAIMNHGSLALRSDLRTTRHAGIVATYEKDGLFQRSFFFGDNETHGMHSRGILVVRAKLAD